MVLKFIFGVWGLVRRTVTLVVFLAMLAILVVSHTVGSVAAFTTAAIRTATGLSTVSSSVATTNNSLRRQLAAADIRSSEQTTALKRLRATNATIAKQSADNSAKMRALEGSVRKLRVAQEVTFRGEKTTVKKASE